MNGESFDLLAFDADGALEETASAAGVSRSDLLRLGALGGGALVGSAGLLGALAAPAGAASAATKGDIAILNYALTLEYLEEAFYSSVHSNQFLAGGFKTFAIVAGQHEARHRAFLVKALGSKAVKKPIFDFRSTTTNLTAFVNTAISLEDTGVAAYAGQVPRIKDKGLLIGAVSILTVEARHAAWIRALRDRQGRPNAPAPVPFGVPQTMPRVLDYVKATHFIIS